MEIERIQGEKKKTPSNVVAPTSQSQNLKPSQIPRINSQTQDRYSFNNPQSTISGSNNERITEEEAEYSADE